MRIKNIKVKYYFLRYISIMFLEFLHIRSKRIQSHLHTYTQRTGCIFNCIRLYVFLVQLIYYV